MSASWYNSVSGQKGKAQREKDNTGAVITETFPFQNGAQTFRCARFFKRRRHRNGVSGGNHKKQEERRNALHNGEVAL
jgi:hypothetical protein